MDMIVTVVSTGYGTGTVCGRSLRRCSERFVLLRCHIGELFDKSDDLPQFFLAVRRSVRRHSGHLDAMLQDPVDLLLVRYSGNRLKKI
jgi:hypothetical protein